MVLMCLCPHPPSPSSVGRGEFKVCVALVCGSATHLFLGLLRTYGLTPARNDERERVDGLPRAYVADVATLAMTGEERGWIASRLCS